MRPPSVTPGPDETLDRLNARLRILQRRRGHRATSDDVLLAWAALEARPRARRQLDLGTGKGTVALLLLDRLPQLSSVGVEALPQSHDLALRNAALNELAERFEPRLGDLRDPAVLADAGPFDLVCGAPPFMPLGSGVLPRDPQRAAGRFELRGGVGDYAAVAARHLAPGGAAVLLMDGRGEGRLRAAVAAAGLSLRRWVRVVPRPGAPAVYCIGVAEATDGPCADVTLAMRDAEGDAWSPAYAVARAALALD